MKLIDNWRHVAKRSHSMWGFYLTGLFLLLPELIFGLAGIDTNPRLWWALACGAWVYGMVGRLKDQGIARSPLLIGVLALMLTGMGQWPPAPPQAMGAPPAVVQGEEAPPVVASVGPVSEAAFLQVAVPLVAKWEGLRLEAYLDIVGVPTVCFGETKGVQLGDVYTKAECNAMLAREILSYRAGLHRYFTPETRTTRLTPQRDAAYASLAYNVGVAGAGKSTATRRLSAGDIAGGCTALTWWNEAGGRVIRGLVNRRADELRLCMQGLGGA